MLVGFRVRVDRQVGTTFPTASPVTSSRRSLAWVAHTGIFMTERFERHRQAWTPAEIAKLHQLVGKGMSLKAISKSMTRSEESIKVRAKLDKLKISKKR